MIKRRWLLITAGIPAILLLLVYLTVLFIPNDALRGLGSRCLETRGYSLISGSFGKAFPLGIKVRHLEIDNDSGPVFKADKASVCLRLLPLLIGRMKIAFDAKIGDGTVKGDLQPRKENMNLAVKGVRLEDIPFIPTVTGGKAKGEITGHATIKEMRNPARTTGEVQLEVRGAELSGLKVSGTPLPDAAYPAVQGMLRIKGGRAVLESLTLQGEDLYVRLKGDFPLTSTLSAAPLNMALELMPKPQFMEKQKFIFLLLTKYLTTPGHYQIPIRGTLGKPIMQ